MSLESQFTDAAEKVKNLKSAPADADMLEIYALYKQATVGDTNTDRPGMLDLKGKAKWDSWSSKKGISQDDAKTQYVAKVEELVAKHGMK